MEIVETQLREGVPAETRLTFERLQAAGYNPELARRLIGHIVVHELGQELVAHKPFNEEHYVELLRRRPEVPPPPDYTGKLFGGRSPSCERRRATPAPPSTTVTPYPASFD